MLDFDDPIWPQLEGGYRTPYDARPALRRLEAGDGSAWEELWHELHHQGDVGPASYAALPHLVRIGKAADVPDVNLYALVACIESRRRAEHNPDVPPSLRGAYDHAWGEVVELGLRHLAQQPDTDTTRFILSALALERGLDEHARLLFDFTPAEAKDMLRREDEA